MVNQTKCEIFMNTDDIKKDFQTLINNNWISEEEANLYMSNEDMIYAINKSTSPQKNDIFNALKNVSYDTVKVVILGKDPYPNPKDAHGYAFSSLNNETPDSLKNIFKAIDSIYGSNLYINKKNSLLNWVKQGVLLLNTGLTFEKVSDSNLTKNEQTKLQQTIQRKHMKIWKPFVNTIIKRLLTISERPIVLMLWGKDAHDIVFKNIKNNDFQKHKYSRESCIVPDSSILILQSSHPSPLSVNRGGDFPKIAPIHFKECDKHLGSDKIKWTDL